MKDREKTETIKMLASYCFFSTISKAIDQTSTQFFLLGVIDVILVVLVLEFVDNVWLSLVLIGVVALVMAFICSKVQTHLTTKYKIQQLKAETHLNDEIEKIIEKGKQK